MESRKLRVLFSGHVQGVGFRYTTANLARNFQVVGTVRNCEDGRVELVSEGTEDELKKFLASILLEMEPNIRGYHQDWGAATGAFSDFQVVR